MSILDNKAEGEMLNHENKMMAQFKLQRTAEEEARRSNGSKQVIVMRTDLKNKKGEKVRSGKLIAQGAHASGKVILDMMSMNPTGLSLDMGLIDNNGVGDWLFGKFTKVCCKVNSEDELLLLYEKAKDAGLPCSLILDAGLTEFSEPTHTCIAIGPAWTNDIDKITSGLSLF